MPASSEVASSGEERGLQPPQEAQSKGWQNCWKNEYFKLKSLIFCAWQILIIEVNMMTYRKWLIFLSQ